MALEARKLTTRIVIQQPVVVRDGVFNSPAPSSWQTVATVWASVEDAKVENVDGEDIQAHQQEFTRKALVCIRYRSDVTNQMRINVPMRNRLLRIVNIQELGRRDGLALACEEYQSR